MSQPLVSLLTPCFNTAKYIHRLLDSVLFQTYPNIEMVVVDDGSADNSKGVVDSYIPKFKAKGFSLNYFYQPNSGQSVAIQNGLQHVKGKYLSWPDSDDFFSRNDAVEKMVEALENADDDVAMVRSQEQLLDQDSLKVKGINGINVKAKEAPSLFEDCLFCKNGFYFCPGAYLVDLKKLIGACNWPMFVEKNAGQNWQLFLPVLWKYRCISIPEVFYSVLIRKESHSRGQYCGYEKTVLKNSVYRDTILGTLDRIKDMPENTRSFYKNMIEQKYSKILMDLAFRYNRIEDFLSYTENSKKIIRKRIKVVLMRLHLAFFVCKCSTLVMKPIRKILKFVLKK